MAYRISWNERTALLVQPRMRCNGRSTETQLVKQRKGLLGQGHHHGNARGKDEADHQRL